MAVAEDMQKFVHKFYSIFPHLSNSPLFLAGESYAGKYIPNIVSLFLQDARINIKGVMIGDGLIDPAAQITEIPQQASSLGIVSPIQMNHLQVIVKNTLIAAQEGRLLRAADLRNSLFSAFKEYSGGVSFYDIRMEEEDNPWEEIQKFMQLDSTKKQLNIPLNSTFMVRSSTIKRIFHGDIFKSALDKLDQLLEKKLPTLLFAGQYDARDGIPGK